MDPSGLGHPSHHNHWPPISGSVAEAVTLKPQATDSEGVPRALQWANHGEPHAAAVFFLILKAETVFCAARACVDGTTGLARVAGAGSRRAGAGAGKITGS